VKDILDETPLPEKWRSFGWHVIEVDGHDIAALQLAFAEAAATKGQPTVLIAHTIKGKGVSFMENNPKFHGTAPTIEEEARALAEHNITCNAFAPGVVDTPLWTQLDADLLAIGDAQAPGQAMADFSAGILRGRAATPQDIVGTALFLASSDSDYLTGQVIMVDGGMVLV